MEDEPNFRILGAALEHPHPDLDVAVYAERRFRRNRADTYTPI